MTDLNIHVEHLTRVEGHGNIVVNANNGEIIDARFDIVETPRFFEAMLPGGAGRSAAHHQPHMRHLLGRPHLDLAPGDRDGPRDKDKRAGAGAPQDNVLRRTAPEPRTAHVFPRGAGLRRRAERDTVGTAAPDVVKRALKLKKIANHICEVIAGRHVHPIGMVPGGFSRYPSSRS